MQLAAAPKLPPPPKMSRGIPFTAARKVQERLLAGLGQRGDRVLVSSFAGVHPALGDINHARTIHDGSRGAYRCTARLFRVNRPGLRTVYALIAIIRTLFAFGRCLCLGYQNIPVNLDEALRQIGGYLHGVQHHERAQRVTHSLEALDEGLGRR